MRPAERLATWRPCPACLQRTASYFRKDARRSEAGRRSRSYMRAPARHFRCAPSRTRCTEMSDTSSAGIGSIATDTDRYSNPCASPDTGILTSEGNVPIAELEGTWYERRVVTLSEAFATT